MLKILLLSLLTMLPNVASANLIDTQKQDLPLSNLMPNGGFENGKDGWSASGGTLAFVTSGSNLLTGKVSATWDSNAASQTFSRSVVIPNGLKGRNGVLSCNILTPSGTATHTIQAYDGTNVLASSTVMSSTSPVSTAVNFVFPTTGSISLRLVSVNANEPLISVDDCFVGSAYGHNLTTVSQASFVGESYIAATASCTWTRTNTAVGAFGTTAACPGPTIVSQVIGSWQTTDSDLPRQTINNLPPGYYRVTAQFMELPTTATVGFAISDGTTTSQIATGSNTGSVGQGPIDVVGYFSYTNAGNRSFEVYGAASSGTASIRNSVTTPSANLRFIIERFPSAAEAIFTPETVAGTWAGYHDNTCSWSRTNTALGDVTDDASCALVESTNLNFGTVSTSGSVSPAITFTPKRAGKYLICARPSLSTTASNAILGARLTDGTTVIGDAEVRTYNGGGGVQNGPSTQICGVYTATDTSAKTIKIQTASSTGAVTLGGSTTAVRSAIEWSLASIDVVAPAPIISNGVVSSSSGTVKIVSAYITNAGTPTITRQDGSWITTLTDNGTGDTTVNIASGTFSTIPACTVSALTTVAVGNLVAGFNKNTAISTTAARVWTGTTGGATVDNDFMITCIGAP